MSKLSCPTTGGKSMSKVARDESASEGSRWLAWHQEVKSCELSFTVEGMLLRLQNSRFFFHIRKVRSAVHVSVIQTFLASLLSLPYRFDTRFKLLVRIPPASLEPAKSVLQSRMLLGLCLLHTESFLCLNSLNDQKCSRGAFIITICAMWWFLSFSWLGNC